MSDLDLPFFSLDGLRSAGSCPQLSTFVKFYANSVKWNVSLTWVTGLNYDSKKVLLRNNSTKCFIIWANELIPVELFNQYNHFVKLGVKMWLSNDHGNLFIMFFFPYKFFPYKISNLYCHMLSTATHAPWRNVNHSFKKELILSINNSGRKPCASS